jgi:diketogulonate reductase-like aldo/keto reductase
MSELPLPPATRQLGTSGIEVSPIAWGMWRLAENGRTAEDAAKLVHAALDSGITFLDTADIYGFDGSGGFDKETITRLSDTGIPLTLTLAKRSTHDGKAFVEIEEFRSVGWGPPPR